MEPNEKACPDCAETIKRAAKVCRFCGARLDQPPSKQMIASRDAMPPRSTNGAANIESAPASPAIWIAFGAVVLAVVAGLAFTYADGPAALKIQEEARKYISKDFLDPSSAQFNIDFTNDGCVTGKVNAKNSFGAYTGFEEFYYNARRKNGRVNPGIPTIDIATLDTYDQGLKDWSRYNDEVSYCIDPVEFDKKRAQEKHEPS